MIKKTETIESESDRIIRETDTAYFTKIVLELIARSQEIYSGYHKFLDEINQKIRLGTIENNVDYSINGSHEIDYKKLTNREIKEFALYEESIEMASIIGFYPGSQYYYVIEAIVSFESGIRHGQNIAKAV